MKNRIDAIRDELLKDVSGGASNEALSELIRANPDPRANADIVMTYFNFGF
jgi:hypothetical protein